MSCCLSVFYPSPADGANKPLPTVLGTLADPVRNPGTVSNRTTVFSGTYSSFNDNLGINVATQPLLLIQPSSRRQTACLNSYRLHRTHSVHFSTLFTDGFDGYVHSSLYTAFGYSPMSREESCHAKYHRDSTIVSITSTRTSTLPPSLSTEWAKPITYPTKTRTWYSSRLPCVQMLVHSCPCAIGWAQVERTRFGRYDQKVSAGYRSFPHYTEPRFGQHVLDARRVVKPLVEVGLRSAHDGKEERVTAQLFVARSIWVHVHDG